MRIKHGIRPARSTGKAGLWLGGFIGALLAGPLPAATLGLVVGINQYVQPNPPLKGAINDAQDIRAALETVGVKDVIVLLDGQATRKAIIAAWNQQVSKAKPGDTLIFTYAGHGGREPERIKGSEADGKDESLVLGGFQTTGPGNGERIIDDELYQWFSAVPQLNIVFVADACYSGTLTRSIDPRAAFLGTRGLGDYGPIQNDPLPPPKATLESNDQALAHVTFLAASQENQKTPEFLLNGQPRGALSWAFAQALRGAADANRDQQLDREELNRYVVETVRMYAEAQQHPKIEPLTDSHRAILPAAARPADRLAPSPVKLLRVLGLEDAKRNAVLTQVPGVQATQGQQTPDLIWDAAKQQVLTHQGDIVAYQVGDAPALSQVIAKWRALDTLRTLSAPHSLKLRLEPGDGLHREGSQVSVRLEGHRYGYLTLFNLAADGTVQFLYPQPDEAKTIAVDRPYELSAAIEVTPPFGADHLVALITPNEATQLHLDLRRLHGRPEAEALDRIVRGSDWSTYQMGVLGLYTAPKEP